MPGLVKTMEQNNIDGRMLLDDCSDEDIAGLVQFAPLRRKLTRSISSLRQQSAELQGPVPADMREVSAEIQRSLDQLNDTLRNLAETVARESNLASGKPPAPADALPQDSANHGDSRGAAPPGEEGERKKGRQTGEDKGGAGSVGSGGGKREGEEGLLDRELAATKIQALERGRRDRARVHELKQGRTGEDKGGAGSVGSGGGKREGEECLLDRELVATKIQALERGRRDRARVHELKQGRQTGEDKGGAGSVGSGGGKREGEEGLLDRELAATKIQALERGRRDRARVHELKQGRTGEDKGGAGSVGSRGGKREGEECLLDRELVATKIQALERGRRDRARVHELKQGRMGEDNGGAGSAET
jgi:hypothetical protein